VWVGGGVIRADQSCLYSVHLPLKKSGFFQAFAINRYTFDVYREQTLDPSLPSFEPLVEERKSIPWIYKRGFLKKKRYIKEDSINTKYERGFATFYSRSCKFCLLHRARKSQVSASKCFCLTSMSLPPGIAPLVTITHAHQLYLNISISNQRLHFW
jgi:hypothetical protein